MWSLLAGMKRQTSVRCFQECKILTGSQCMQEWKGRNSKQYMLVFSRKAVFTTTTISLFTPSLYDSEECRRFRFLAEMQDLKDAQSGTVWLMTVFSSNLQGGGLRLIGIVLRSSHDSAAPSAAKALGIICRGGEKFRSELVRQGGVLVALTLCNSKIPEVQVWFCSAAIRPVCVVQLLHACEQMSDKRYAAKISGHR